MSMWEVCSLEGVAGVSCDPIGGECRITASTPTCHVMLGCKGVGLGSTVKEVMTARVLQVGCACHYYDYMCVLSTYWGWRKILSNTLVIHCQGNDIKY